MPLQMRAVIQQARVQQIMSKGLRIIEAQLNTFFIKQDKSHLLNKLIFDGPYDN